jgi:kumamolisin
MKRLAFALVLAGCGAPAAPPLGAHQPARVLGAAEIGHAGENEVVDLVIGLRARPGVDKLLAAQKDRAAATYRRFLTPDAFAAQFGPSAAEYQRVIDWATAHGLEIVRTTPSRTTLSVRGTVPFVERAFGTRLLLWRDDRGTFRAPTAQFSLGELDDLVVGVVGLDTATPWTSRRVPGPIVAAPAAMQTPANLSALYNITGLTTPGKGQTVAILGTGFSPDPRADVDGFIRKFTLPTIRTQQYTQVFLGGPNRDNDNLANNEYGENLLDIDMVLGLAPYANVIHVFTAQNGGGLFADGIVFIVNQAPHAHSVSVSYGTCERVAVFENLVLNSLFAQAQAQGQSWFIASGDDGTDGCRDGSGNQVLSVDWPSSSVYTYGVGGTQLSGATETGWNGSGGGQSELNQKPAYQEGVGPFPNDGARDVPDIAALAGSPGVATFAQGQTFASEGTSAAAPMWAAVWAIIDQSQGGAGIPDGHERLYALGQAQFGGGATVFHDITTGNNKGPGTQGFNAVAGYDLVTGWGTPNTAQLIANW